MRYTITASVSPDDDTTYITSLRRPKAFKDGDIVEIQYPDRVVNYIVVRDYFECNGCDVSKIGNEYAHRCLVRVRRVDGSTACLCANSAINLSLKTADSILEDL